MLFGDISSKIEKYTKNKNSEKLISLLKKSDPAIRKQVIKALGTIDDDKSMHALINQMNDLDPETRLEVIRTMGTMNNQMIKSHLQHLVKVEKDESILQVIKQSISNIPNKN